MKNEVMTKIAKTILKFENQECNEVSFVNATKYYLTHQYSGHAVINNAAEENNNLKNIGTQSFEIALTVANLEMQLPNGKYYSFKEYYQNNIEESGEMLDDIMSYILAPDSQKSEFTKIELSCYSSMIADYSTYIDL